ncbi:hypothetical protein [Niallia sp. Man26]|uniref:hypothetical protein n=1 Tax=Niallia sp. Man26 TaxID=2912824 RepID=UPI001EDC4EE0|nr:hypothetical protein [Niallia sp. Man26]UPO88339.1 hypothetical protein L8T27_004000 [Niallia sp. Man26]
MASRIKGITIELGADTTSLEGALSDVNKKSKQLQSELKDVEKLLKFDPNNVELLAQRQQLLTDSVENTRKKLDQLKQAEAQVQQQFERGDIKEEQYRAFQRELQDTERTLQRFQDSLDGLQREQEKVGEGTRRLTTLFEATGTAVEDYSDVLGQRLVRAIQNGTATSRDLENTFQRIGREAIGSNGDIERLRNTLRTVDSGNSIRNVRTELQQLENDARQAETSIEDLDYDLENVAGALIAGGGISGAIESALESSSLDTKIELAFDIPEESIQTIKNAILDVNAVIEDEEAAVAGVRRQWALNKDATDEANLAVIQGATTIAKTYEGIDFTELIQEVNEIASELKISDKQAVAFANSLLKMGFPPEQIDIIAEYGQQLQRAGYDATEIQGIFAAGVDTGTWNIDNLLDGLKEGRIQMAEFSSAMSKDQREIASSVEGGIDKFDEWALAIAEGGEKGSKAMREIAETINEMEGTAKNDLGTLVFGTMFEDQGQNIIDTILNADSQVTNLGNNIKELNKSTATLNADPAVKLQKAFADLKIALQPLLTLIADIISKFAEWVSNNPVLAATITAISVAIGILLGLIFALAPIFATLASAAAVAQVGIGALMAPFTGIVIIVTAIIAIIGLLIAAFVALYQNNEDFRNKVQEIWTAIKEAFFIALDYIKNLVTTIMTEVSTFFGEVLGRIKAFWDENGQQIMAIVDMFMNNTKAVIEGVMGVIKGIFEVIWPLIVGTVRYAWETIQLVVKTAIDLVLGIIQTVLKLIKGDWEGAWESIKQTFENIWDNITSFLEGIDLAGTGKQIMQGLIDGIASMGDAIWDSVTSIGQSIKDGFTSFFDINSPSRLMRDEIGKYIGAGLAVGMEQSTARIARASDSMKEAAYPDLSKGSTTNASNNTFNFNGMLNGAVFNVREEADIDKIATKLRDRTVTAARKGGVIFAN